MARSTGLVGALGTLLMLGCNPPATAPAAVPTSSTPTLLTAWREVTYPQVPGHVLLMGNEPEGTQLIAVDGFRMKQRGERIEFAKQALHVPIFRSCPAGTGWIHVTEARDVYRSHSFLGKLEFVGRADNVDFSQCGPQAVTLRPRPIFWSNEGAQPLTWDSPIGWASFSDAKRGQALAFPDFGLTTSDGGKTFVRASVPISMVDAFARVPPAQWGLLSEVDFKRVLHAWSRRALRSVAGRAVADAQLSDGTAFRITATQDVLLIDLRSAQGKFSSVEVSGNCNDAEAWGSKLALLCFTDPEARQSVLRIVYPTTETLPGPPLPPQSGLIADTTGRYLFAQGQPVDHPRQKTGPLLRFDGKVWQVYEHIASQPITLQRGWLLLDNPPRVVPAEHPEQDAVLLPTTANLEIDLQEAAVLEHSIVYVQRAKDGTKSEWVEVELANGRELKVTPLSSDTSARLPPELRCSTSSCGTTPTIAWTRLPDEDEPELLPTPPPHDYRSPALDIDSEFSIRSYECELLAKFGRKDQELGGIVPVPGNEYQRIVALPSIGGMLDLGNDAARFALSWHGVDTGGAFAATTAESKAVAELKAGLPRSTVGARKTLPVLVTRHFVLLNEDVGPELTHRVRLLGKDGSARELVPSGDFQLLAVPLGDGRSLLSIDRDRYQELMLLASDGSVAQRRYFLNDDDLHHLLAVRAGVPGLVSLGGSQPTFFSLEPETPGIPVAIATERELDPCRKKPSPDALRLFVDGDSNPGQTFSITGFSTLEGRTTSPRQITLVDSTPSANCLRGVLLDGPASTELFSRGSGLRGRLQGQTKTYPLVCRIPIRPPSPKVSFGF